RCVRMVELYLKAGAALAGAIAAVASATWFWRNRHLLLGAWQTEGTVTRVEIGDEGLRRQGILYRYVVRYRVDGQLLEVPARPKSYGVGQAVTVRYRPEDPSAALAGWLPELLLGPSFMLAWGLLVVTWAVRS